MNNIIKYKDLPLSAKSKLKKKHLFSPDYWRTGSMWMELLKRFDFLDDTIALDMFPILFGGEENDEVS